jgi:hypothetical protein
MRCENCNAEWTFWIALKQLTSFRFKCSKCKAKYKISTPWMPLICVGVCFFFIGLCVLSGFCAENLGVVYLIPCFLLYVVIWMWLEILTYRYISKYGTFTRIGVVGKST